MNDSAARPQGKRFAIYIMKIATKKSARFLLDFAFIALLSVTFFGPSQAVAMERQSDGTMSGCLFTGMEKNCKMTLTEHLSQWQSMFTTTAPQKALALALLILLAVVFVAVATFKRNLVFLFSYSSTRWRLYIRHNPELSLFDPLKKAFSHGILNPKIY